MIYATVIIKAVAFECFFLQFLYCPCCALGISATVLCV